MLAGYALPDRIAPRTVRLPKFQGWNMRLQNLTFIASLALFACNGSGGSDATGGIPDGPGTTTTVIETADTAAGGGTVNFDDWLVNAPENEPMGFIGGYIGQLTTDGKTATGSESLWYAYAQIINDEVFAADSLCSLTLTATKWEDAPSQAGQPNPLSTGDFDSCPDCEFAFTLWMNDGRVIENEDPPGAPPLFWDPDWTPAGTDAGGDDTDAGGDDTGSAKAQNIGKKVVDTAAGDTGAVDTATDTDATGDTSSDTDTDAGMDTDTDAGTDTDDTTDTDDGKKSDLPGCGIFTTPPEAPSNDWYAYGYRPPADGEDFGILVYWVKEDSQWYNFAAAELESDGTLTYTGADLQQIFDY